MIIYFRNSYLSSSPIPISICEKYMLYGNNRFDTINTLQKILKNHNLIGENQGIDISAWSSEYSSLDRTKRFITRCIIYNDVGQKIGDIIVPLSRYRKPECVVSPVKLTPLTITTPAVPYTIRFT